MYFLASTILNKIGSVSDLLKPGDTRAGAAAIEALINAQQHAVALACMEGRC